MTMNVKLLRQVQKVILEEPKRVNMGCWLLGKAAGGKLHIPEEYQPKCGTIGCIAGWTCVISKVPRVPWGSYYISAMCVLEIGTTEADSLFIEDRWPADLLTRLQREIPGTPEYAAVVSERIDRFIETKGGE